jgi:hypothetical protein
MPVQRSPSTTSVPSFVTPSAYGRSKVRHVTSDHLAHQMLRLVDRATNPRDRICIVACANTFRTVCQPGQPGAGSAKAADASPATRTT